MQPELPEGTVTILFTDVEGSTDLTGRRGDEDARALLRAQGELVREQVRANSGYEVKSLGDGFMVAFSSARYAVACAIGIQRAIEAHNRTTPGEEQVRLRIGINTGEVIREGADLFGQAVNAAARVAAKANGGQILLTDTVKGVLGPTKSIDLIDRGRFRLKGIPERWRLHEVVWQEERPVAAAPLLAERTPFVRREPEQAELRRLLERAVSGNGALVMISGEPGVGKTRLAQELALEGEQSGVVVRTGRCYEMEGGAPYIPFVEMLQQTIHEAEPGALRAALGDSAAEVARMVPELRSVFPDIPPPLDLPPEQERLYFFNSMRDFLERASRLNPLVLVIDDLHWADDSTLLLLQHIAQQLRQMAVLVIATHRDVEPDMSPALSRVIETLLRQRLAHRIALKRLPQDGVKEMLGALRGQQPPDALVQTIYGETEGNAFFVEEVLKHLAEEGKLFDAEGRWREDLAISELDVPEGVRLVIGRRLDRLSNESRKVLAAAAVIGRGFSFELLSAMSEAGEDALLDAVDEAERAHLIASREEGGEVQFAFAHELIRQTILSDVSAARRQRLHLRAAEAIERLYVPTDEHAADLVHHLREAGAAADPQKTGRYLAIAGERALSVTAFEDALRFYEGALALHPEADRRGHADLLYKRGLALRSLGRWDEALAGWQQAVATYQALGDAETVGHIYATVGRELLWAPLLVEALDLSQRGLVSLGKRVSADRCLLLTVGGLTLSLAGFYDAADRMIGRSLDMAESLGDRHLLGLVLGYKGVHHYCYAQIREQLDAGLRATELLRSVGALWDLADALWVTEMALVARGRFAEASQVGEELEPLAARLGHLGALMVGRRVRGLRDVMRTADIDRFEDFARNDFDLCSSAGLPSISQSHTFLGLVQFWRGQWSESLEHFQHAAALESPGIYTGLDSATLFLATAYAGDEGVADAMLRQRRATAMGGLGLRRVAALTLRLLMAAKFSGLSPGTFWRILGRMRLATMEDHLPHPGQANTLGSWVLLLAVAEGLVASGRRDRAGSLYPLVLEAIDRTGSIVCVPDPRLLQTVAGITAAAGGRWTQAEQHYREALRQAHELPHKLEQPEVRRWYARMLLDRDAPGDRDKAVNLITEAIVMYRNIGMPKHIELAQALLAPTS